LDRAAHYLQRPLLAARRRVYGAQTLPEAVPAALDRCQSPTSGRRALRYGNGFFGGGSATTAQFAQQVHVLRQELAESQQDASFQIAKRVYIAVDDNVTRAHERFDAGLKQIYGSSGMAAVAVYGPPSACIKGLREVADAGAELIQLHPLFDEAEQMERLAAEALGVVQNN
jgi:hypothetical protein